jgi:hypothetical protein
MHEFIKKKYQEVLLSIMDLNLMWEMVQERGFQLLELLQQLSAKTTKWL